MNCLAIFASSVSLKWFQNKMTVECGLENSSGSCYLQKRLSVSQELQDSFPPALKTNVASSTEQQRKYNGWLTPQKYLCKYTDFKSKRGSNPSTGKRQGQQDSGTILGYKISSSSIWKKLHISKYYTYTLFIEMLFLKSYWYIFLLNIYSRASAHWVKIRLNFLKIIIFMKLKTEKKFPYLFPLSSTYSWMLILL